MVVERRSEEHGGGGEGGGVSEGTDVLIGRLCADALPEGGELRAVPGALSGTVA